jgi:hypothetical protein
MSEDAKTVIEVRSLGKAGSLECEVVVRDADGETRHRVTVAHDTYERLTGGKCTPEQCMEAAFAFLLEREPKESILRSFDLIVISRYFPEFEREFPRYLQQIIKR